mmetsp:Transcript_30878/g.81026  ORF Transcript_30878/g.81026 Transcript_30878/m.81026 type:complete len:436 (+) Transcript_30878:485-1792(+)
MPVDDRALKSVENALVSILRDLNATADEMMIFETEADEAHTTDKMVGEHRNSDWAATLIQKTFRGIVARKEVKERKFVALSLFNSKTFNVAYCTALLNYRRQVHPRVNETPHLSFKTKFLPLLPLGFCQRQAAQKISCWWLHHRLKLGVSHPVEESITAVGRGSVVVPGGNEVLSFAYTPCVPPMEQTRSSRERGLFTAERIAHHEPKDHKICDLVISSCCVIQRWWQTLTKARARKLQRRREGLEQHAEQRIATWIISQHRRARYRKMVDSSNTIKTWIRKQWKTRNELVETQLEARMKQHHGHEEVHYVPPLLSVKGSEGQDVPLHSKERDRWGFTSNRGYAFPSMSTRDSGAIDSIRGEIESFLRECSPCLSTAGERDGDVCEEDEVLHIISQFWRQELEEGSRHNSVAKEKSLTPRYSSKDLLAYLQQQRK